MTKPRESTIQVKALKYLRSYYAKEISKTESEIYCEKEKWTKEEFGGKRADGLICFEKNNQIHTVSLEAKSHKTLGQLISNLNDEKLGIHCLLISSVLAILTTIGFVFYSQISWLFTALLGIISFIVYFFLCVWLIDSLDLNNYKFISVINQLKQYPANEQWIAYSKHTDNLLLKSPFLRKKDNLQILDELCEKNRFGLLVISNKEPFVKRKPIPKKGNYSHYYVKEKEIINKLNNKTAKSTLL